MDISEKIKFYRKEKGLTQYQLGQLINKSSQVISNWERGYTTTINNDDIKKLSIALTAPVENLLSDFSPFHKFLAESSIVNDNKKYLLLVL